MNTTADSVLVLFILAHMHVEFLVDILKYSLHISDRSFNFTFSRDCDPINALVLLTQHGQKVADSVADGS